MIGMNRQICQFQKSITGDKNETGDDLIAQNGDPDLIVTNVLRAPLGHRRQIKDARRVWGISRINTGRQFTGIRFSGGTYDRVLYRQIMASMKVVSAAKPITRTSNMLNRAGLHRERRACRAKSLAETVARRFDPVKRLINPRRQHKTMRCLGPMDHARNCFQREKMVPGGGIEPPTRGFSIDLLIRARCFKIAQLVPQRIERFDVRAPQIASIRLTRERSRTSPLLPQQYPWRPKMNQMSRSHADRSKTLKTL